MVGSTREEFIDHALEQQTLFRGFIALVKADDLERVSDPVANLVGIIDRNANTPAATPLLCRSDDRLQTVRQLDSVKEEFPLGIGEVHQTALYHLTRPKISDRWRGRVSLPVECGSHRTLKTRHGQRFAGSLG